MLSHWKLKKYHLRYFGIHLVHTATKCDITIIETDRAKVVFKSLLIGLKYSCKPSLSPANNRIQSRNNENTLARNMNINIQPTRNRIFLANFLSQMKSLAILYSQLTIINHVVLKNHHSFLSHLLKLTRTISNRIINIQVVKTVLDIQNSIPQT